MTDDQPDLRRNAVLAGLPDDELDRVLTAGKVTDVEVRQAVYDPDDPVTHVHFPLTCVFSYVALVDGEIAIEVATIGCEGMVGLPAYLGVLNSPHSVFCQVPGVSLELPVDRLRELQVGDGMLHEMLNRYVQALMIQMAQNVACNRMHSTEERAARWLLTTRDRVTDEAFPLTQQFLAQMLGVRRPTVSLTASVLQSAGLIRYRRGMVTITDEAGLLDAACDCYRLIRDETERLMTGAGG